jgi:hypothetical protein
MHCSPFIQISIQHHVWRVDATHKLVGGCDDFWFYLWIAIMSSPYFLFLGCGMAGEKTERISLWCILTENTCEKGPDLQ